MCDKHNHDDATAVEPSAVEEWDDNPVEEEFVEEAVQTMARLLKVMSKEEQTLFFVRLEEVLHN